MNVARLVDIADVEHRIRNAEIANMVLCGPAMVVLLGGVSFEECIINGAGQPIDALLVEVSAERMLVGPIGLERVTFRKCRFESIGFIGTPEQIAQIRAGFTGSTVVGGVVQPVRPPAFYDQLLRNETTGEPTP